MKIIHKRSDGGVSITTLAIELSSEKLEEHASKIDQEQGYLGHRLIEDESLIPSDRDFRNAWTDDLDTKTIDIDISKAHEIKKEQMRAERKPLLEALDIEVMKALENGTDTKALSLQKQDLRDVTKLELPTDIEALKAFMPHCLKGE